MNIAMTLTRLLFTGMLVVSAASAARAGDIPVPPRHAAWQAECGSCHVAYPPALLDAAGWRTVMAGLDRHFGSDASLDDKTRADIGAFLARHAGRTSRLASPDGRLSATAWFRHEHDEVPARVWRDGVKSPAQCQACHTGAAQGRYGEGEIRLPRASAQR